MNTTQHFYNSCYKLYPVADYFLKGQKKVLARRINQLPEGNLLEIGIGNGSVLPLYQKHNITGIDTATNMLGVARKRKVKTKVDLRYMNGEALSFGDSTFDYVVISHVLSVTANPEDMLQESYRVLKPGGLLLVHNHFTPANILQYMDRFFSLFTRIFHFRSAFKIAELDTLHLFRLQRQINMGPAGYFKIIILEK